MSPERPLVFLDASLLVSASRSPSGGSALTMEVCRGRRFRAAVTARVLLEARINIAEKFGEEELVGFYQRLAALDPEVVPPPPAGRVSQCVPLTTELDAHVLARLPRAGPPTSSPWTAATCLPPASNRRDSPSRWLLPETSCERWFWLGPVDADAELSTLAGNGYAHTWRSPVEGGLNRT